MTNPSVLILRITAAILIILVIAVTALAIRRNRRRERDRHDGHPRYRSSSLDSGIGLPDDGVTDFEAGGVEMHKTSRLNPGFFGGKNTAQRKPIKTFTDGHVFFKAGGGIVIIGIVQPIGDKMMTHTAFKQFGIGQFVLCARTYKQFIFGK